MTSLKNELGKASGAGMEATNLTDRVLIEKTLEGDELAFAELVGRYQTAVWRTVRRRLTDHSECEDAMQEIFMRVYASLHNFDSSRPFDRWVMRITTNYCIDVLRRRSHQPWVCTEYKDTLSNCVWDHSPERSSLNPSELRGVAQSLLEAIKPANRNAFVLRELEGLEYTDVGRALRISPLAARVRVSRARKEMHHQLRHFLQPGIAPMRRPAMAVA